MENSESIILGVASGVLASLLLLLASAFVKGVVIPWYRQLLYKGIDISGEWVRKTEYQTGAVEDCLMTINQKADKLQGIMNIVIRRTGVDTPEMATYKFSGKVRDRFVQINGRSANKNELGIFSELLVIMGRGDKIHGCTSWYSITNTAIKCAESKWSRK